MMHGQNHIKIVQVIVSVSGLAMAQTVRRLSLTAETRVRS